MDSYTVKPLILKSYFNCREAWYTEAQVRKRLNAWCASAHAAAFAWARRAAEEKKEWTEM